MGEPKKGSFLTVERINTYYGKSHILFNLSMEVEGEGHVVCLMGRNGAGKTTALKSIMGWTIPRNGSIKLKGVEVLGKKPHALAKMGVGLVPEDRRVFSELSVGENLRLGGRLSKKVNRPTIWREENVFELFPVLKSFYNRRGGDLSGGQQQMLTIGRTLMMNPELLLLDEPAEGLAPIIVKEMAHQLSKVKEDGMTMVLTEQQHIKFVENLADSAYIIDKGEIKFRGSVREIMGNEELKQRYLAV